MQINPIAKAAAASSYGQTLKSTAMIGGSTLVNIIFSIIRNKAVALLLGPSGVGLLSLYTTVMEFGQNLAGLGVQNSGVREIAVASASQDPAQIATTAIVLRRISFALGLLGAGLLVLLAGPISQLTFGGHQETLGISLLAVAIFFRLVSAGQAALVQGMRRIGDLARMNILSAVFSTATSIPLIYFLGEKGIVPSLIATAAMTIVPSWWFSRKIPIEPVAISLKAMAPETVALLKLGLAFLASGILTLGAGYAIRVIVLQHGGIAAAGLYQAAWSLGGLYAGVILQAMGADFYPRLTGVARDDVECNRLVNEQAEVCILLAGPGVIATLTLAPLVMLLFYSHEFQPATGILRLICLGMMMRIVAWPMGFVVLAKNAQWVFFITEVLATAVHVGLAWLLVPRVGVEGAGVAFLGLYVWHSVLIYFVVRRMTGFCWSRANIRLLAVYLPAPALVLIAFGALPYWIATGFGLAVAFASGVYSLYGLLGRLPPERLPKIIRPLALRMA